MKKAKLFSKSKRDIKVPLPQDPVRAYQKGCKDASLETINWIMKVVVWVLVDNEMLTPEEIVLFDERFKSTIDMLKAGNISINDIRETLKKEYGWEVVYH